MILVVKLLYCQIVSLLRAYAIRPYKSYLLSITVTHYEFCFLVSYIWWLTLTPVCDKNKKAKDSRRFW